MSGRGNGAGESGCGGQGRGWYLNETIVEDSSFSVGFSGSPPNFAGSTGSSRRKNRAGRGGGGGGSMDWLSRGNGFDSSERSVCDGTAFPKSWLLHGALISRQISRRAARARLRCSGR